MSNPPAKPHAPAARRFNLTDLGYLVLFWVCVGSVLFTASHLYPLVRDAVAAQLSR
jgi:hypothetical protein